jgi:hypothetical protein
MAFRRRDRRERSFGINEEALSRDIQRAQRAAMGTGMQIGREATDAARGASSIYADQLASARGIAGTGLGETFRGLMSSADADAINQAEARRKARLLQDTQGIGASMLAEKAASKQAKAEKRLLGSSIAGSAAGALGGIGAALSLIPGPTQIPGAVLAAIGAGTAGAAGAGSAVAKGDISKIQSQVAGFDMPEIEVPDSTGLGITGQDNFFTGGAEGPKRKRRLGDSFAEALAGYSSTPTYFG